MTNVLNSLCALGSTLPPQVICSVLVHIALNIHCADWANQGGPEEPLSNFTNQQSFMFTSKIICFEINLFMLPLIQTGCHYYWRKKAIFCATTKWCKKFDFLAIIALFCYPFFSKHCSLSSVSWPKVAKRMYFGRFRTKYVHPFMHYLIRSK